MFKHAVPSRATVTKVTYLFYQLQCYETLIKYSWFISEGNKKQPGTEDVISWPIACFATVSKNLVVK